MAATARNDVKSVAPEVVIEFLKNIMPFKELDDQTLRDIARHVRVDFFPKKTRLLTSGETELTHLYLIQRGGVKSFIIDDEGEVTLKDYRGEGAYVGALPIIRGTRANLNVETVEDTFCFLLPREIFLDLIREQPGVAQYYLKSFSEKIVNTAYTELRRHKMTRRGDEELYLFTIQVEHIIKREPRKIAATSTIQEAAQAMTDHRIGSLLIHDENDPERIVGIITDRDLRNKVIAQGRNYRLPVKEIMTSPVASVLSQSTCFDALLKMMSSGIHHLAVERKDRVIGVITSHDIMLLQGTSPYSLFKEIGKQQDIAGLYPLSRKIPDIIRNLIKEGAKTGNIARMISLLNDHILDRLLSLLEDELGPPPVPYCWMLLGSEGRWEQTFKTDQDNALVYADPEDESRRNMAEEYFSTFTRKAIDHLVDCGYPLCPGEVMAVNPKWRQPLSVWENYFTSWINTPEPQEVRHVSIFFDFRAGYGSVAMADTLRRHIKELTARQEIYLLHLARECMNMRAPLSFFKNFIVEKNGEHKNKLDIKRQGITPFVNFARIMALKHGVRETNTLARLKVLAEEDHISQELWMDATEAFEIQMHIRLIHQLYQIESGAIPDNYIDPAHLSDLDKRMLKNAFAVIDQLHAVLKSIFGGV
ncbi:MAG TPA: cyclic nucleotide-binding/CBS domain-containing protein [Thermodesulfobacteriaceae bacterium]|nr:cyclic nucleotide-binding/CBS domain-containing protein [Thermodesulfobacteriaceae bacterium]